ncbi:YchJ family protein [Ectothiorhodospiraceae bacterium WFHF3C12]|nr:YchJ family protein [Ectothiorhodospiraceae bacterium WFHF3C12]
MIEKDREDNQPCPCGSGHVLGRCCGPCLDGAPAPTAEALMRSRYTANVLGDAGHLRRTWDPRTCPEALEMSSGPVWESLEIRHTEAGEPGDDHGVVEFVARFHDGRRAGALHETSRFRRIDGWWVYVDGDIHPEPAPIPRNAPCPCGSGKKYKRCCASR